MKLYTFRIFTLFLITYLLANSPSLAGPLSQYKNKKFKKQVANCSYDYVEDCSSACYPGDVDCVDSCIYNSTKHCRKKVKRKKHKKWAKKQHRKEKRRRQRRKEKRRLKNLAKHDHGETHIYVESHEHSHPEPEPADTIGPDVLYPSYTNPYKIDWNNVSFVWDFGAGKFNDEGTNLSTNIKFRKKWFGFGANYAHLSEYNDYISELDFGPTINFGNADMSLGLQPSMLISSGKDVDTEFGAGLRAYTRIHFGKFYLAFDPMLGKVNDTWQYHAKMGGGYRFTPHVGLSLMYEERDVLSDDDITKSDASLNSLMANLQIRFN